MSGLSHLKAMVLVSALPLLAAGCAGQPTQMGSFAKNVPDDQAMLLPPPGGPGILSVIERRYGNAVVQDVYLNTSALTPGQNAFKVQFFGTANPFKLSDNDLTSTPVTQAGVALEMREALPGIRMTRSSFYVQNNYGPFGYAFGRGRGDDLCMYAWQQVRAPSGTISPLANYGSIQVRLRLCQSGATEERLLAVMYNYSITGSVDAGGWNPYGEPQPVSPTLGGVGAPIYPRSAGAEPIVPVLGPRRAADGLSDGPTPAFRRIQPIATQSITATSGPERASAPLSTPASVPAPAAAAIASPGNPANVPPAVMVPRPGYAASSPRGAAAPVPGPAPATPAPLVPALAPAPAVSRAPLVPSPSGLPASRRIPPPSCTDATSEAVDACR